MLKKITLGIINPSDLSKNFVSGGSSGLLKNIIPYLNAKRVVIFGIGRQNNTPWMKHYLKSNVEFLPICNLEYPSKIPMRLKVLWYYFRYRKKILNSGVDVLYIQMPECCIPFLSKKSTIPIIYHKHGSTNPVAKSKYLYGRFVLFQKFYEIVLLLIYRNANWIITIDRLSFKEVIKKGAKNRTSMLMNAVDLKKCFPNNVLRCQVRKNLGLAENIFAILFVGRIEKTKGPERLIDCIPLLKKAKHPFHIFFAGEGTFKIFLENKVKTKLYDENVTFLGHIPHEDMPHFYNAADVMVLPSETEGVPMVILEALACGTPVIASKVGAIPDLVFNGINGTVLDIPSPEKITSAIINISSKKINRQKIYRSVKDHSARNFVNSLDVIISNVLKQN